MLKSKYIIYSVLFFGCITRLVAQHHISKYEKCWALAHPFAALKIKKQLKNAMIVFNQVKLQKQIDDTLESGGKLDAFRHAFTMAYLAQRIPVKKLRKLGIAHEKGNKLQFEKNTFENGERPDSLACDMDLKNNELGFFVGSNNKNLKIDELKLEVIARIKLGNAWILKKNAKNEYITCNNESILIENYKNNWFLPKCLIKSDDVVIEP